MDSFLDSITDNIAIVVKNMAGVLDLIVSPLHALGPVVTILGLALAIVLLTKYLSAKFVTKRYQRLKTDFEHYHGLRNEALKHDDPEKGKRLARNIDQGKLNKVYYDYFFEGLMLGLATKYLPILIMIAYINDRYRPEKLQALFGQPYVFLLPFGEGGTPVGSIFWYIFCLLSTYIGWAIIKKIMGKGKPKSEPAPEA